MHPAELQRRMRTHTRNSLFPARTVREDLLSSMFKCNMYKFIPNLISS